MIKRIIIILVTLVCCVFSTHLFAAEDQATQQLQQLLQAARQQAAQAPNPNLPAAAATAATPPSAVAAQAATAAAPSGLPQPRATGAAAPLATTSATPTPTTAPPIIPLGTSNAVTAVDTGADVREEAFAAMTQSQLPLTPAQIRTLRLLYDETQRAAAEYPGVPPKPTSSSLVVNLSPGAAPPVIRLQSGFITSLVFVDSTGAPWPIKAWDLGDPQGFNIQWDQKGNTLLVQAITQYKAANLAVQLQGLNTPVMLTLLPGQAAVDYRVDLHVPGIGPKGFPIQNGLPPSASPLLLEVLSGIPPVGSRALTVIPEGYANVWLLGNYLYVMTRATVLSPAWIATMSSSDGTHAYKMPLAPMIIVSMNGKLIDLNLEGY